MTEYQQQVLKAALDYYDRGSCVIPLKYGSKIASIPWRKYQEERPTREQVEKWFSDGQDHNIGIICGKVSGGLVVLVFNIEADLDTFLKAMPQLEDYKPYIVKTFRGYHLYTLPTEVPVSRIYDGGRFEIKSDGTYVVAPPSLHPEGVNYEWVKPE